MLPVLLIHYSAQSLVVLVIKFEESNVRQLMTVVLY